MIALLLALQVAVSAKTPLTIISSAKDSLGQQFAFALKEQFQKSASITVLAGDGIGREGQRLLITSVTAGDDLQGPTAYSVALVYRVVGKDGAAADIYEDSYVGACGRSNIDSCALRMFNAIGADIDNYATKP